MIKLHLSISRILRFADKDKNNLINFRLTVILGAVGDFMIEISRTKVLRLAYAFLLLFTGVYSFLYGLSAIANIIDIYEEYTLSVLGLQIDIYPFPLSLNLISAGLIAFSLIIGSIYILIPYWEELKKSKIFQKIFLNDNAKKDEINENKIISDVNQTLKEDSSKPVNNNELQEQLERPEKINPVNGIIGVSMFIFGLILFIRVIDLYFRYAPLSLVSMMTWNRLNLNLPVFMVMFIGILLCLIGVFLLIWANNERKYLEDSFPWK